jgi:hypothetical protein
VALLFYVNIIYYFIPLNRHYLQPLCTLLFGKAFYISGRWWWWVGCSVAVYIMHIKRHGQLNNFCVLVYLKVGCSNGFGASQHSLPYVLFLILLSVLKVHEYHSFINFHDIRSCCADVNCFLIRYFNLGSCYPRLYPMTLISM